MFRLRELGVGDVAYALKRRELRLATRISHHLVSNFVHGLQYRWQRRCRRSS
jgi:hypothetical protein